ncbi:MAG: hypothetical protein WBN90_10325, partial [Gammaproteobacteria bacterium]
MAKNKREELEAFAKKMHDEGAAGFAAGLSPWETWDDFEDRVGSRVWQGTAEHVPDKQRPTRSFGDRVLTAMTALAVASLAIGIAGVFMSHNSTLQLADNSTRLLPASAPDSADTGQSPAFAGANENVAPDDVMIPAIAGTVSPDVNNATSIEFAAAAAEPQLTEQDSDTTLPVTPVADETLIATLEQKLASLEQQLESLEQPPAAAAGAMPVATATGQLAGMDSGIPTPAMTGDSYELLAMLEKLPATAAGVAPAEQSAGMVSNVPAPLMTGDDINLPGTVEEVTQVAQAIQAPLVATSVPAPGVDNVSAADRDSPQRAALNQPPAAAAGTPQADAAAPLTAMKPDSIAAKAPGSAPSQATRRSQLAAPARPAKP